MVPLELPLQQTVGQRMQLLVQVVRGCTSLLTRHQLEGHDATFQPAHHNEHVALMLMALQLLHVLCLPPDKAGSDVPGQQQQQQQHDEATRVQEPAGQTRTLFPACSCQPGGSGATAVRCSTDSLRLASVMLPGLEGAQCGGHMWSWR